MMAMRRDFLRGCGHFELRYAATLFEADDAAVFWQAVVAPTMNSESAMTRSFIAQRQEYAPEPQAYEEH